MRIAHVSDCYLPRLGGIELQVHDLASRQIAAGHDVRILTATRSRRGAPDRAEAGEENDPPVSRFPGGIGCLPSPPALAGLRKAIRSGQFDAVHVHSSVVSPGAWAAGRMSVAAGIPTVLTMHSVLPSTPAWLRMSDALAGCSRWPIGWSAVSEVAAAPLREVLGAGAVSVLPNGIDPAAWATPQPPRRVEGRFTVVSVLRLSRRKRPLALLHILAAIQDQMPPGTAIEAVLIGDGPQQARMERRLRDSGMDSWVRLTGRLTRAQIRPLLAAADVYLAPAEQESFGIAALEARCAGLPVIAMAKGGVGEFIHDGEEGFLVGSDEEMARTTAELLLSDRLRPMQTGNRSSIPEELTWPHVVRLSLDLYRAAGATDPVPARAALTLREPDPVPIPADHQPAHA